ncbi:ABC transporter permease [Rhodovulum sulfidophilum]|uniref:ABC transporter permease n=1 Tax=Rhodovulum sulfidophilum TaxID=35806 RepID=UPI00192165C7|nr:ABC transporter permease [Rhodovulum sulfidophilum]MBL3575542.1 ABC transporter permease [Rhodovulum sulfidophilum]MCE8431818.1 ABC transporter permease [Rhodovulum sulfidophilum]MCF4118626.1 ABC transporter permease [Rhodovulum sulfidophilum]
MTPAPVTAAPIPAAAQVLGRLAEYALTLGLLILLNYTALWALPGDPLMVLYDDLATGLNDAATQDRLREMHGLGHGYLEGLIRYAGRLAQGDLGHSIFHARPVAEVILPVLPWTALLVVSTAILSLALGPLLGIELALRDRHRASKPVLAGLAVLDGIPGFVKAIAILLVFSVWLGWLPVSGAESLIPAGTTPARALDIAHHAAAPILTLVASDLARFVYFGRAAGLRVIRRPMMAVAQGKSIRGAPLRLRYILANATPELIARTAMMLNGLLIGTVFVETVFAYPGLGGLLFEAVYTRDQALAQAILLPVGALVLTINLLADLAILAMVRRG